jgi:hypothetical protein
MAAKHRQGDRPSGPPKLTFDPDAKNAFDELVKRGCNRKELLYWLHALFSHVKRRKQERELFGFDQTPRQIEQTLKLIESVSGRIRRLNASKSISITRLANSKWSETVPYFDKLPKLLTEYVKFVQKHVDHCKKAKSPFRSEPVKLSKLMLLHYVHGATGDYNFDLLSKLIFALAESNNAKVSESTFGIPALTLFAKRHSAQHHFGFLSPYFATSSDIEPEDEIVG